LEAPMDLTRRILPLMLAQRRGHIVNISSLAGKSGPGFQEPYAATKAGLSAFTMSLRSTYRGSGVSASAITPGFVDAGMYTRLQRQAGRSAPLLLGSCPPEAVCRALLRALRKDTPEICLNSYPIRPILALTALFPRFGEWLTERIGVNDFFRQAARMRSSPFLPDAPAEVSHPRTHPPVL
ncbi:MAG: SDR family NAD(P)-dependent oxidoreductase, partial [Verrucomicrobiae bacterium]|nr:SDR family NAD(P)-dependent oxidoreductase [Verrucomicrobiae bacterium]